MSTEPFWYNDPSVLFSKNNWYVFVPQASMPVVAALNAVVRFSVYLSILLAATSRDVWYLLLIPLVMVVTIFLEKWFPKARKISEGFRSGPVVSGYEGTETSQPTTDNPFMNPQLTEIHADQKRPPAADVTDIKVRDKVNESFAQTSNIYMDTSDVFDLVQSQRNFYTVPEDDHAGFLAFLGKNAQYSNQKLLSEGFVVAKGTFREMATPAVSSAPEGTAPADA
jgi:hypothetical protein